jgi:hypothetical protein
MRMIKVKQKTNKTKLVIAAVALTSLAFVITGSLLFNPLCLGAGVAGLFITCGVAISVKPRAPTHLV